MPARIDPHATQKKKELFGSAPLTLRSLNGTGRVGKVHTIKWEWALYHRTYYCYYDCICCCYFYYCSNYKYVYTSTDSTTTATTTTATTITDIASVTTKIGNYANIDYQLDESETEADEYCCKYTHLFGKSL